ncbi:MAG: hypothetical protein WC596_03615 [Candidatus Shapirobacteria bacterium]
MKGSIAGSLLIILLLLSLPILFVGYLGFIPRISSILGSNQPRDLGVKATSADLDSVNRQNGIAYQKLADNSPSSILYSGQKDVSVSLTSPEITALANSPKWKYYLVKDVQIKINPDGSGEVSGILLLDRLPGYLEAAGLSSELAKTAADALHLQGNPPFYFKGMVTVTDNQITLNTQKIEIGRVPIPSKFIIDNQFYLVELANARRQSVPGLNIKSLNLSDGKFNFIGTIPQTISWQD